MYSDARGSVTLTTTDPHVHPALRFNYLSTDQDRREWVEAIRVARRDPRPAGDGPVQRRRDVARARRSTPTRRSSTGSRATPRPRSTRRARRGWGWTTRSVVDPLTMRVHGLDGLRVVDASVDAVRHQRQHLRAGDDARREGRRPDPGRHAAAARAHARSTGTSPAGLPAGGRGATAADRSAVPDVGALPRVAAIDGCPCPGTDARRLTRRRAGAEHRGHPPHPSPPKEPTRWKPSARHPPRSEPLDIAAFAAASPGRADPSRATRPTTMPARSATPPTTTSARP